MPLVDPNLAASYTSSYGDVLAFGARQVELHYHRALLWENAQARAQKYVELLGLTTDDRIAIVGCGYGWTVEALVAMGYAAAGTDVSAYIHNTKGTSEAPDIDAAITVAELNPATGEGATIKAALIARGGGAGNRSRATVANEDLASAGSRNAVRRLFAGNRVTVAISEDLLTWLTDAEISAQATRISQVDPTNLRMIAHYVTPAGPGNFMAFNWKSPTQWRSFLDGLGLQSHRLIIAGTWQFL